MAPCLTDHELGRLQHGELSDHDRDRIEAHARECPGCSTRIKQIKQLNGGRGEVSVPPQGSTILFEQRSIAALNAAPIAIEGYQIQSEIHRGGQGIVYKAFQRSTNRTVAIKVLPFEHSATERQKHRFEREVTLASNLHHPNIVTIYDSGLVQGRYYFVMEYIHGDPLDEHLKNTTVSLHDKLRLFATICSAVNAAHQQGVTHRDLKPRNILVDGRGEPHVVDFGLAKGAPGSFGGAFPEGTGGGLPVSMSSEFLGTLAYAAPEQTKGDPTLIGPRTDVYSLGVILFEMLTGTYPYPVSGDMAKTFRAICETPPRPPSELAAGLDRDIDTIVLRALAKEPDRRYQSVGDLQRDVEHWVAGEPIQARRDSFAYVIRRQAHSLAKRHRVMTLTLIAAAALALGELGGGKVVYSSNWLNERFMRLVTGPTPPSTTDQAYQHVRVVAIQPDTDVEALASQETISGVDSANWKSVRSLHGHLMKKLVDARPRAVAWDISFPELDVEDADPDKRRKLEEAEGFNQNFARGVQALHGKGIEVAVAAWDWGLDEHGRPPGIAKTIVESGVRWGAISANTGASMWTVDLAVQRGSAEGQLSLSLATLAAWRNPGYEVKVSVDAVQKRLTLSYYRNDKGKPPVKQWLHGGDDQIELFVAGPALQTSAGIQAGDVIGVYAIELAPQTVMDNSTLSYQQVMSAAPELLKSWFDDKVVLFADCDPSHRDDRHRAPDGRMVWGCFAHASAIEALLTRPSIRYARPDGRIALSSVAALAGVFVGLVAVRRRRLGAAAAVALAIALVAFSIVSFRQFDYLIVPFTPILTIALAALAAFLAMRRVAATSPA